MWSIHLVAAVSIEPEGGGNVVSLRVTAAIFHLSGSLAAVQKQKRERHVTRSNFKS